MSASRLPVTFSRSDTLKVSAPGTNATSLGDGGLLGVGP